VTTLIARIRATNKTAFFLAIGNVLLWTGFILLLMLFKR